MKGAFSSPIDVHVKANSYLKGFDDISESKTMESRDLPKYIKTLLEKDGYSIEYILIMRSCNGCG